MGELNNTTNLMCVMLQATLCCSSSTCPSRRAVLPEAWTKANIVPIPNPHETDKFRPISLTPVICKILERVLLHRLLYKMGHLTLG